MILNVYAKIITIVLLYWIISITLIFLNKIILDRLNAPFFLTWFQCLLTVLILIIIRLITNVSMFNNQRSMVIDDSSNVFINLNNEKSITNVIQDQLLIPKLMIHWTIARRILPLSTIFVSMILFSNISLKLIGISFYFVARSLTPVFNVIFTRWILRKNTSIPVLLSCASIISGFIYGKFDEKLKLN